MSDTGRRENDESPYANIKIEYHDPTDAGRIVSQTFSHPGDQPLLRMRKVLGHVSDSCSRIAVKREPKNDKQREVVLINDCWDLPDAPATQTETRDLVEPSPRSSDSGIESDCADGNLSWLLNYKIQELPPVPGEKGAAPRQSCSADCCFADAPRMTAVAQPRPAAGQIVISEGYRAVNQKCSGPRKPPFTYTELIEHALSEKGELTVSGIYTWITDHFPFYKANDDRWKNSVRHNLSINPHFRKGGKAVHGAGHLWTIAQKDEHKTWQMKQRIDDFIRISRKNGRRSGETAFDEELQAATESILGEIQDASRRPPSDAAGSQNEPRPSDAEIQVEFINLGDGTAGLEDFLSPPVSKQDLVNECGLGSDFFITDIDPNHLGLSLAEAEVTEEGIYDEMSLDYYGLKE